MVELGLACAGSFALWGRGFVADWIGRFHRYAGLEPAIPLAAVNVVHQQLVKNLAGLAARSSQIDDGRVMDVKQPQLPHQLDFHEQAVFPPEIEVVGKNVSQGLEERVLEVGSARAVGHRADG